jgi:MFS transporter, FSR family, fosmidomycin resistance protein
LPLAAAAILAALLSDVWSRARLVVLGQCGLAAALFFTAWTSSPWGLASGLAVAGAASGVACGAAQALLLIARPEDTDRAMVRWSLYCAIGDVLTPVVTAVAIASGHSYRAAMGAIAVIVSAQCALSAKLVNYERLSGRHERSPGALQGEAEPLRAALARALRLPRLWAWLFAAASCTLLDELVIALAVLRFAHERAVSAAVATAVAVTFSMGSVVGAAITDRAVARTSARRVLVASAALTAVALLALLSSRGALEVGVALLAVGMACAAQHPLAFAQAYGEIPEYPGAVQAMGQVFVVVDVAAPIALGAVADHFGLDAALGCLLVQPAIVLTFGLFLTSARRRRSRPQ